MRGAAAISLKSPLFPGPRRFARGDGRGLYADPVIARREAPRQSQSSHHYSLDHVASLVETEGGLYADPVIARREAPRQSQSSHHYSLDHVASLVETEGAYMLIYTRIRRGNTQSSHHYSTDHVASLVRGLYAISSLRGAKCIPVIARREAPRQSHSSHHYSGPCRFASSLAVGFLCDMAEKAGFEPAQGYFCEYQRPPKTMKDHQNQITANF